MARYLIATLVLASAIVVTEAHWRIEHALVQPSLTATAGSQVADVRVMPEGSSTPYGIGVFLRPAWSVLHSLQSTLVFSAYCGQVEAVFADVQQLRIRCDLLEGEPVLHASVVNGTTIEVTINRKHTVELNR